MNQGNLGPHASSLALAEGAPVPAMVPAEVPTVTVQEAAEIAGISDRAIRKAVASKGLTAEPVTTESGPNKGRTEYRISLPDLFRAYPQAQRQWEARQALARLTEAKTLPPTSEPPEAEQALAAWQREIRDARLGILRYLEQVRISRGVSKEIANSVLCGQAATGQLPPEIAALVPKANARGGRSGSRTFSRRTLERWEAEARLGLAALAPKHHVPRPPAWLPLLLDLYRQPQKPTLALVVSTLLPPALPRGVKAPSYSAALRALAKVGELEKARGRMLPRELKTLAPFVRRDFSDLMPLDAWIADGHTFDAEVAHPGHGRPFRPELTTVMDLATRRIVGWSVGLAEGALVVVDALRHGITSHGVPAIFYSDNGPGYINSMMVDLCARLGISHTTSIPYNSQARGVIERAQKTVWVELAAKRLPTYMGRDMDREARQIVFKHTRREDLTGALPSWGLFVDFITSAVEAYNSKPHRTLKGMAPDQRWQGFLNGGWTAPTLDLSLSEFLPQETRRVRRGEVSLYGHTYFSRELAEWHGQEVRVAYDVHDAGRVWIRDREGRLLCEAEFEANSRAYFPKPFVERAREVREQGRLKRLARQVDEVRAEARPAVQEVQQLTPSERALAAEMRASLNLAEPQDAATESPSQPAPKPAKAPASRAHIRTDLDWGLYVMNHPEDADPEEIHDFNTRLRTDVNFRLWLTHTLGQEPAPIRQEAV